LTVSHGTGKNVSLPILGNIMIKAHQNTIELSSTNLEIGIVYNLRGKVEEDGDLTVDSKLITEYINLLPGGKVILNSNDDNELNIECDNYKTKVKGESAKDFPLIPVVPRDNCYSCDILELKKALNNVVFAVSNNETRIELSGVFFNFEDERLTLVSTDSYRLAERSLPVKSDGFTEQKIIVPARTVQELLRILNNYNSNDDFDLKQEENQIIIAVSDNQISFTIDAVEIVSRLINGQYPDYRQIIPDKSKTEIIVDRQEILRAVKAVAIFSKTGINDVDLEFNSGKIIISASSGQSGESRAEIKANITGGDNEIAINFRYLIDGLNNISSDLVKIKVISANVPCILTADTEDNYLYVVMPIRQ
jgi:DNA polymerase-3 subunit beta